MSMPFYVAPEQMMKDRADYARKGIARGRALVAVRFVDGIAIVAENASDTLRKVSEIYDRIAFAGVGKYNEFDQLRVAGVRAADLKGYQYSRDDVDARSLANSYAQMLGNIFTHEMKPMEVEILVAEVGLDPAGDQMFHILYDGTVVDQRDIAAIGGDAETIKTRLAETWTDGLSLAEAIKLGVRSTVRGRSGDRRRRPRGGRARPHERPAVFPSARPRSARSRARLTSSAALRSPPSTIGWGAHRSQQRPRRIVRGVEARRRRGHARGRHECQHRLRLPRRRSVDAAGDVCRGGRPRRGDRRPGVVSRPRGVRSPAHRHGAVRAARRGDLPARSTRRVRPGRGVAHGLCEAARRAVPRRRTERRLRRGRRGRRRGVRPVDGDPRPAGVGAAPGCGPSRICSRCPKRSPTGPTCPTAAWSRGGSPAAC